MRLPGTPAPGSSRVAAVMLAEHVVSSGLLSEYVPGDCPERPVDIPVDDEALRISLVSAQRARAGREEVETLLRYNRWVNLLVQAEARACSRLTFLMGCWEDLREETDAYLQSCAGKIAEHVERHWPGLRLLDALGRPTLPTKAMVAERQVFISGACRRTDLVATWLLRGLPSPRFIPQEHAFGEEDDGE